MDNRLSDTERFALAKHATALDDEITDLQERLDGLRLQRSALVEAVVLGVDASGAGLHVLVELGIREKPAPT